MPLPLNVLTRKNGKSRCIETAAAFLNVVQYKDNSFVEEVLCGGTLQGNIHIQLHDGDQVDLIADLAFGKTDLHGIRSSERRNQ